MPAGGYEIALIGGCEVMDGFSSRPQVLHNDREVFSEIFGVDECEIMLTHCEIFCLCRIVKNNLQLL